MRYINILVIISLIILVYFTVNYLNKSLENYENKDDKDHKDDKNNYNSKLLRFLNKKIGSFKTLYKTNSEFQQIEIIQFDKNKHNYDKCLLLDGEPQLCNNDEHEYHELIVHYPASFKKSIENVLIIGGGDCMTLREVMKYKTIKNVYMLELDENVVLTSKKYLGVSDYENDGRVKIIYGDADDYIQNLEDNFFDLVIIDTTEDNNNNSPIDSLQFFKKCKNKLRPDGIFVKNGDVGENIINAAKLFKYTKLYEIKELNFLGRYPFIIASDKHNINVELPAVNKETKKIVKNNDVKYFDSDLNYLI